MMASSQMPMGSSQMPMASSQMLPPTPSSGSRSRGGYSYSPPPLPSNEDGNPILQDGSGVLNDIHLLMKRADDGAIYQLSSSYKPGLPIAPTPTSGRQSQSQRGGHSQSQRPYSQSQRGSSQMSQQKSQGRGSSPAMTHALGTWQLRLLRQSGDSLTWYAQEWGSSELKAVLAKTQLAWPDFERKFGLAWTEEDFTFGANGKAVRADGSFDVLKLIVGDKQPNGIWLRLNLEQVEGAEALRLASFLAMDLARSYTGKRIDLLNKEAQLKKARQQNGETPTVKALTHNTSIVDPGRIKRKRVDDGGFEEDSQEDREDTIEESVQAKADELANEIRAESPTELKSARMSATKKQKDRI